MSINYQRTVLQILIILIYVGLCYLTGRLVRGHRRRTIQWSVAAILIFALAFWNLGWYWSAYPLLVWMAFALLLIVMQTVHHHEFIYRRYWLPFWRYSTYIAIISYGLSIFSGALPLI